MDSLVRDLLLMKSNLLQLRARLDSACMAITEAIQSIEERTASPVEPRKASGKGQSGSPGPAPG